MDHEELLRRIEREFSDRTSALHDSLRSIDDKLDRQLERLIKVEAEAGWLKKVLFGLFSLLTASLAAWIQQFFNK